MTLVREFHRKQVRDSHRILVKGFRRTLVKTCLVIQWIDGPDMVTERTYGPHMVTWKISGLDEVIWKTFFWGLVTKTALYLDAMI